MVEKEFKPTEPTRLPALWSRGERGPALGVNAKHRSHRKGGEEMQRGLGRGGGGGSAGT